MSTVTIPSPIQREPELPGQTVVVIGGSAGIGFETARRARAEGAKVILTGRNAERLQHAASEVDALSTAASMPRILLLSIGSSVTSRQSTT
jgi:NAD(P)-dependent dehydrogenase (short-subunit alcohol dehydrogenase family)